MTPGRSKPIEDLHEISEGFWALIVMLVDSAVDISIIFGTTIDMNTTFGAAVAAGRQSVAILIGRAYDRGWFIVSCYRRFFGPDKRNTITRIDVKRYQNPNQDSQFDAWKSAMESHYYQNG